MKLLKSVFFSIGSRTWAVRIDISTVVDFVVLVASVVFLFGV